MDSYYKSIYNYKGNVEECSYVYVRKYKSEKFMIVLNPSFSTREIYLSNILVANTMLKLGKGVKSLQKKSGTILKMSGVSYGIFRL